MLLHGAGGRGEGLIRRFMPLAQERGVVLIAPDAQRRTWDAILGIARGAPQFGPDVAAIDAALTRLFAEINIDPARTCIGGFSDGASYALSLGPRNGDLFTCIMALSPGGVVPFTAQGRPRVFISHGRKDSILDFDNTAKGIAPGFSAMGLDVTFVAFDGDHELREPEMRAGLDWFLR
jgi:phospholipase/carboxylesterase